MAASPLALTGSLLEPLQFPVYHHSLVISLILTILSAIMIPNLYSQFRPLSCTSDLYATLYYLHLTFPKINWLCPSLKRAPPKAIPSQVMVPPFIQLLKPRTLGSLSTILFLWVLIQCIRRFFKMYPTAAPHFTQGKCLQWPDYLLLPLSAYLLSLLSHPIPSRQALLLL